MRSDIDIYDMYVNILCIFIIIYHTYDACVCVIHICMYNDDDVYNIFMYNHIMYDTHIN